MNNLAQVIQFNSIVENENNDREVVDINSKAVKGAREKDPFRNLDDIRMIQEYFLRWGEHRNYLMFTLGCNLSLRASDLLSLKWGDIFTKDENGNVVYGSDFCMIETKTKKAKFIRLNKVCKHAVEKYISREYIDLKDLDLDAYLFPSRTRDKNGEFQSLSVGQCGKIIKEVTKKLKIEGQYCSHSMRKTFGYHYFKSTGDITTLTKLFNHDSLQTTLVYIGISKDDILGAYDVVGGVLYEAFVE